MKRGLVISTPVKISKEAIESVESRLDPQELRSWLLFWDKLDFPANRAIFIPGGPEVDFLTSEGILERTQVPLHSGTIANIYRDAMVSTFRKRDLEEPGMWSIAVGERSASFDDHELIEGRGVLVRLNKAIPVPDKEVSLQDILEFRNRRQDELLSLRHHLEEIYQRIIKAGDGPLALQTEIERLEMAIQDHLRVSKESGFGFRNMSLDASLNMTPIAAGIAAYLLGVPIEFSLATGVLSISINKALAKTNTVGTPYRYISQYHERLF